MNPEDLVGLSRKVVGHLLTDPDFRKNVAAIKGVPAGKQKQQLAAVINKTFPSTKITPDEIPDMNKKVVGMLHAINPQNAKIDDDFDLVHSAFFFILLLKRMP